MNGSKMIAKVMVCVLLAASASFATNVFYDLGSPDYQTGGNYNNLTISSSVSPVPIANSVDENGNPTGIGVAVYDPFFPNYNPNGTQDPTGDAAMFEVSSTRDAFFGNTSYWQGATEATGGFLFTGLNPSLTYDFTFFASRMGVSDNREAQYTVTGLNSGMDLLNSANNVSEVAVVAGIMPTATGEITIDVTAGPNNTSSVGFYYLGSIGMQIVPEPSTLAMLLLAGAVVLRRR